MELHLIIVALRQAHSYGVAWSGKCMNMSMNIYIYMYVCMYEYTKDVIEEGRGTCHGLACGAKSTPGQQDASFLPPHGFFAIFYCCFIFLHKKRSPEILVQLNLGLCDILESSIFSCTHIVHLIVIA